MAAKTKTKVKVQYHDGTFDLALVENFDPLVIQKQLKDPEEPHVVIGGIIVHSGSVNRVVPVIEE